MKQLYNVLTKSEIIQCIIYHVDVTPYTNIFSLKVFEQEHEFHAHLME